MLDNSLPQTNSPQIEPSQTDLSQSMELNKLRLQAVLIEYTTLKNEILLKFRDQIQMYALLLAAMGGITGYILTSNSQDMILILPLISNSLAFRYFWEQSNVIEIGNYLKKLEYDVFPELLNDRENPKEEKYVFSWDEIPGNDNRRLMEFLTQEFRIEWVKNAKIEKIDNGKTIKVSAENKSLSLKLNDKNTEVILEIDDHRTNKFTAKMEEGKLNIYEENKGLTKWIYWENYFRDNCSDHKFYRITIILLFVWLPNLMSAIFSIAVIGENNHLLNIYQSFSIQLVSHVPLILHIILLAIYMCITIYLTVMFNRLNFLGESFSTKNR
jgi:hypothetical protein